jgi:anti-sigma-K factor RskA
VRKRRDDEVDDGQPRLISLDEKHEAHRRLQQALAAGELDEAEYKRRLGRVYQAVTPRELWKASGHRAGSRRRSDRAELWRAARLQIAIVAFAVLIMIVVLWGTVISQQGGADGISPFPWEWGGGD